MAVAIRCLAATYYGGFHIKPHRHHWGQLIYAAAGLLRVLVLELVERCPIDEADAPGMRLAEVAIDRIAEARTLPLQLPLPRDPRALRLVEILRADPADPA